MRCAVRSCGLDEPKRFSPVFGEVRASGQGHTPSAKSQHGGGWFPQYEAGIGRTTCVAFDGASISLASDGFARVARHCAQKTPHGDPGAWVFLAWT